MCAWIQNSVSPIREWSINFSKIYVLYSSLTITHAASRGDDEWQMPHTWFLCIAWLVMCGCGQTAPVAKVYSYDSTHLSNKMTCFTEPCISCRASQSLHTMQMISLTRPACQLTFTCFKKLMACFCWAAQEIIRHSSVFESSMCMGPMILSFALLSLWTLTTQTSSMY